jgi:hypothetical protein
MPAPFPALLLSSALGFLLPLLVSALLSVLLTLRITDT